MACAVGRIPFSLRSQVASARPSLGSSQPQWLGKRWLQACATAREENLKQLQDLRQGVSQALSSHEQALKSRGTSTVAAAGQAAAAAAVEEGEATLRELTKDDFQSCLDEAGEDLVVVDFYTDWCGPCKVILPKLVEMSQEMSNVQFVKFNCNKYNKDLGKSLGIKVAPTFQLYKSGKKVAEMTGAKVEELRSLIEKHA